MNPGDSFRPTRLRPRLRADLLRPGQQFRLGGRWYALREAHRHSEHVLALRTEQGPSLMVKAYEALEVRG